MFDETVCRQTGSTFSSNTAPWGGRIQLPAVPADRGVDVGGGVVYFLGGVGEERASG